MRVILARIGRLALLAAQGPGAWRGIGLYLLVLSLQFAGVWVTVQMINWQKTFYDALEQFDAAAALVQIGVFGWLTALSAGSWLAGQWLRKHLLIAWREKLTGRALDLWVNGKAYWYLRPGLSPTPLENPDQRIAEDCAKFIDDFLEFTLELISRVVSLVTYLSVLWGLSHFPLALTLWGVDISIPRYMVWAAFLYVFLSSILTHALGKPLKNLAFAQERREADFRHALVQIRDQADQIAQAGGEAAELRRTGARFEALKQNWKRLITRELVLGLFVRPYRQSVLRIPTFLALPAYFGGAVTLGGLMQLASAFSNVATTLSWFIFSYRRLAGFVAVSERLDGLFAAAGNPAPLPDAPSTLERRTATDGILRARGVQLYTPQGRALEAVPDFTLSPGETLWLSGASGRGKSTFLSALRGVWPFGTGVLELPDAPVLALPQVPVSFAEGILPTLTYPHDPADYDRAALEALLLRVGLGHRLPAQEGPAALQGLSIGERQRLALARVLLLRPDWLILDEATSALDAGAETDLLGLLRAELPRAAILCVAHRPPLALGAHRRLSLSEHGEPEDDEPEDKVEPEERKTA